MKRAAFITFILFAQSIIMLCAIHPARAGMPIELDTLESKNVVVHFEKPLLEPAKEIIRLFPLLSDEITKLLQWEVRFQPEVILIKDSKTFKMLAGNDMIVAFANPKRQLIVIDYSRMGTSPITLDVTLKHELCHLLLHANIRAGLPRWFDEGVSQWVTGGLAEILVDNRKPELGEAALSGRLIRFYDLSTHFPEDRYDLVLAYEQSRSIVEYICATYGPQKLLQLLNVLKNGMTMDDAVQQTLGLKTLELERRWVSQLNERFMWLAYLSDNLYEILFLFASLVTVIGAVKTIARKLRNRALQGEEKEDEKQEDNAHE
jgi:hypothetical protein